MAGKLVSVYLISCFADSSVNFGNTLLQLKTCQKKQLAKQQNKEFAGCQKTSPSYSVYLDPTCLTRSQAGCKADGINDACRYCGPPSNGLGPSFPPCPTALSISTSTQPLTSIKSSGCQLTSPLYSTFIDPSCLTISQPGCKADGVNRACRYCGGPRSGSGAVFPPCPVLLNKTTTKIASQSSTTNSVAATTGCLQTSPLYAVFNDPSCMINSQAGCKADGVNAACRYCGGPTQGTGQIFPPCPDGLSTVSTSLSITSSTGSSPATVPSSDSTGSAPC